MINEDSRVLEYALGTLDPAEHAEFERELKRSAGLRAALFEARSLLDTLIDGTEPMAVSPGVRDRLLKSVSQKSKYEGFVSRLAELFDLGVAKIRDILNATCKESRTLWQKTHAPGIDLLHFDGGPAVAGADCGLVRIAPGTAFPHHTHNGDEIALVIAGRLQDSQGQTLHPGDVSFMPAGSAHSFTATGNEELVLAVVVHEGISFR